MRMYVLLDGPCSPSQYWHIHRQHRLWWYRPASSLALLTKSVKWELRQFISITRGLQPKGKASDMHLQVHLVLHTVSMDSLLVFSSTQENIPHVIGWGRPTVAKPLTIIWHNSALQPSYQYLTILLNNNNNNKDAFVSISLGLSSGRLPSSVFRWIRPTPPPGDRSVWFIMYCDEIWAEISFLGIIHFSGNKARADITRKLKGRTKHTHMHTHISTLSHTHTQTHTPILLIKSPPIHNVEIILHSIDRRGPGSGSR